MENLEGKKRIININRGLELSPDIVKVILSKLTICNLPAFRIVSRNWNNLVLGYASSFKFIPNVFLVSTYAMRYKKNCNCPPHCYPNFKCNPKLYLLDMNTKSYIASFAFNNDDWPEIKIINSCHGLLYIYKVGEGSFCNGILNPLTNEFLILPPRPILRNKNIKYFYGFGFDLKTKQYKLFEVVHEEGDSHSMMEVMRFDRKESKEWRPLNCLPFVFYYHGVYLNGVVYWIGREKANNFVIYGLDVETEKIESITILEVDPYSPNNGYLGNFNGNLYAMIWISGTYCEKVQLWMMQGKDSWIKECVIHDIPDGYANVLLDLVKVFEDGKRWFHTEHEILCYDKTGTHILKQRNQSILSLRSRLFQIESLKFGSLPNILAGDNEY